jgi:hypothetical protein
MLGIHVFRPNFSKVFLKNKNITNWINPTTELFGMEDYEVIILYMSVLFWKKFHNNTITLYTDSVGYEIFEKLNLLHLYDDVKFINNHHYINNKVFWAGCKLEVISEINQPFTIFDLDLYVEKNLEELDFFKKDIGILHFEKSSLSYPYPRTMPFFDFPKEWSWDSLAVNVALLHFNDMSFKNEYAERGLKYIYDNSKDNKEYIMDKMNARMIFSEQRLLGEMISFYKKNYTCLITGQYYPTLENDNCIGFSDVMNLRTAKFVETTEGIHRHSNIKKMELSVNHLWGFKSILLNDNAKRIDFMQRLLEKFFKEFPYNYDMLKTSLETLYKDANKQYTEFFSKA